MEVSYRAGKLTPVTYQNIIGEILEQANKGEEPAFLLAQTPSATVYSDAGNSRGYSYFRIRGIDQTRINTTLDGVPLNEPEDQGAYLSNYPDIINSVNSLQIQRGVGTSKNGVSCFGGSVQLFSPDLQAPRKTTFGLDYGSFNTFRAYAEYNSGVVNNKAIYARVSELYTDGYKYHSGNHSQSAFVSAGFFGRRTSWKLNLVAGHQQNQLAWLGVSDSLIRKDRRSNANTSEEKDQFLQYQVQLHNQWRLTERSQLNSGVYYAWLKGNYDFDPFNFVGEDASGTLLNYAFLSNMVGAFTNYTYSSSHLSWTTGVQGNLYGRQHTGTERRAGALYQNTGYKNEFSAFTKASYQLGPVTLFGDVQYRYASFAYNGSVSMERLSWNFLNPKAGISVAVSPRVQLYYSIGQAGREPTRNDLFAGSDDLLADSTGKAILTSSQPEWVTDQELGIRYRSPKLDMQANFYYMNFRNEIVFNGQFGANGLPLTHSVEQSYRAGFELHLDWQMSRSFGWHTNLALSRNRILLENYPGLAIEPAFTPRGVINQEIDYHHRGFRVAVSGRFQNFSFADFWNSIQLKPYFLVNARASYAFNKHAEIGLMVNNLTNTHYYNSGYLGFNYQTYTPEARYFVQAATNFLLSVKYSF